MQASKEPAPSDLSSHNLTAEEFAKLQKDLGEVPSPTANQNADLTSTPPPLVKSTTLKKVMRVTGRTSAAAAATILAVPASITGAIIGGARGAHKGPTALVTGTAHGAAAGGASVFRSFKVTGRKNKDKDKDKTP